ncbi:YfhO family protein [Furfurilactobacillus milii]|uniref:YfhO family protein n=1 Tax=Furfurilactobacillus milii TaxID=2888272 RepID=A0A6N9I3A3_9LACO|nr:YfhO family protein [Furfurilactobacillus milii]MYV16823.1 YfhO family protein [Furfurilactobacillus milii]
MIKHVINKTWPLLLSFLVPSLFMLIYFASRGMAPFDRSSLLTVDMGQQYIDFFAFFRNTLLHHPGSFFYSFSKALGGETTSLWAYYLMSPFNLLLLPFSKGGLSTGVLIMTVAKYGCAGLSLGWVLNRLQIQSGWRLPMFGTIYALSGWTIANQLNLMWLDALIVLPLVVYGLECLIKQQRWLPYVSWLAVAFIVNYYMAYMISLFTILYFIFSVVWHWQSWHRLLINGLQYVGASVLAGGIAAFILLPTYFALQLSKASYTLTKFKWTWDYAPLKMLGKLYPGGFNFAQMPKGQPNLFVGAAVLILVVAFFIEDKFHWSVKLVASLITIFFVLSVSFTPLNLLWHAGQFPIWYPYRFSFIVSFWLIWLAAITWRPEKHLNWWSIGVTTLLLVATDTYVFTNSHHLNFITTGQIITGTVMMLIALICLSPLAHRFRWLLYLIPLLTLVDMGTNAILSLNKISYVPQDQFAIYTNILDQTSQATKKLNSSLYRVGTTFQRTKDDPMQGDYFSGSHFGSTLERKTTGFYDLTGNPDGDGFVTYANGTEFMDALLNMKYFWSVNDIPLVGHHSEYKYLPTLTRKPDLHDYSAAKQLPQTTIYQNPNSLGMGFMAAKQTLDVKQIIHDPMTNQNQLWNALLGQSSQTKLFTAANFNGVTFTNTNHLTNITGSTLTKIKPRKPAQMTLTFTPQTDDAYYLSLGANLQKDNVKMLLNGQPLAQYQTFRNTVLVNIANQQKDEPQKITFALKKNALWLQNVTLYQLPQQAFQTGIKQLQQHPLKVTDWGQTHISGHVIATHKQPVLMTSIPAQDGWQAFVDGHRVSTHTIADEFIALRLAPGPHHITLRYRTPYLGAGIFISLVSLAVLGASEWLKRRHNNDEFVK